MQLSSSFGLFTENGTIWKKPCFDFWVDGFTVRSWHAKTTCSSPDSANFQGRFRNDTSRQCTVLVTSKNLIWQSYTRKECIVYNTSIIKLVSKNRRRVNCCMCLDLPDDVLAGHIPVWTHPNLITYACHLGNDHQIKPKQPISSFLGKNHPFLC